MTLTKPTVDVPAGEAPTDLEISDIAVGDGPEATSGRRVSVQYVGVAYSTGQEFDSSWSRNEPFEFALGAGHVIAGWDRGVAGMRVGGRRRLTIPAKLGYGERGVGNVIKPGETLIFVVDLLGVR
jgi:peptidylprolyl isomerase